MNLFVTKQIVLFGFCATASDALGVGATLCLNLLQEYYGKQAARTAIWVSFACALFYVAITALHLAYVPSTEDATQTHFMALFSPMPRIIGASLISYLITQMTDFYLFGYLRTCWSTKFIVLRNTTSVAITQLIDTLLFSFLGLYGMIENIGSIIIVSYAIKLLIIALSVPFLSLAQHIAPQHHAKI
jgi:uncharacterized integral membrane protein (TIGR00697 family)